MPKTTRTTKKYPVEVNLFGRSGLLAVNVCDVCPLAYRKRRITTAGPA